MTPADRIRTRALQLGFEAVGIARVGPLEAQARYEAWIAAGMHGAMHYLATERHRQRRARPETILPGVQSIVSVALCHVPDRDAARDARLGRIARYAVGEDYHRVMRDRLRELAREIEALLPGASAVWYSDTGAILERAWAERAGLGWIGKHTGLLSRRFGSWFLLGEVLVDRPLDADTPLGKDHCGTCTRCIEACPTRAIIGPRQLDARLCISYLTIELRGPIPRELRPLIGDWVFGCDVCQEVCPWNRFAPPAREARLHARDLEGWSLERFLELDDQGFQELFRDSPIRRAKRAGFLRNVCVALGNRRRPDSLPALARAVARDPSALVRAHAAWAIGEIGMNGGPPEARAALEAAGRDTDPGVREEAALALRALEEA